MIDLKDVKELLSWLVPFLGFISTVIIISINTRKLNSDIKAQEEKRNAQQKETEEKNTKLAVEEALKEQKLQAEIEKLKNDVNFAHSEVRALREKTGGMASDILEIKNGLNSLKESFDEIKSFLREDILKIHERLDAHLQSHNKMSEKAVV